MGLWILDSMSETRSNSLSGAQCRKRGTGLGIRKPRFAAQVCHLMAVGSWTSHLVLWDPVCYLLDVMAAERMGFLIQQV